MIGKIVLSLPPTSDDCVVVALPSFGHNLSIAFCRPGDKSWTFVESPGRYMSIEDVIHFKDQVFYAVCFRGTPVVAYDLADLSSPKTYSLEASFKFEPLSSLEKLMRGWWCDRCYLVESLGNLLWVRRFISSNLDDENYFVYDHFARFPNKTVDFDVYRLDFARNTWECTKCIGDQALFLGKNQSFSLSAQEFPNLKANRIYFTDDSSVHFNRPLYGGHDFGHHDIGCNPIFKNSKFGYQKILPPPIWVMPNLQ